MQGAIAPTSAWRACSRLPRGAIRADRPIPTGTTAAHVGPEACSTSAASRMQDSTTPQELGSNRDSVLLEQLFDQETRVGTSPGLADAGRDAPRGHPVRGIFDDHP
jgi:hypothetical protein